MNNEKLLEEIRKIIAEEVVKRMPYHFVEIIDEKQTDLCMHENCVECRINPGLIHSHSLSCPCPRCSPRC